MNAVRGRDTPGADEANLRADLAREAVAERLGRRRDQRAWLKAIRAVVAKVWGCPETDLDIRRTHDSWPRQIAMHLAHVIAGIPLAQVAQAFERTPQTVVGACDRINELRNSGTSFAAKVAAMEAEIRTALPARPATTDAPRSSTEREELVEEGQYRPARDLLWSCMARGQQRMAGGLSKAGTQIELMASKDGEWTLIETRGRSARALVSGTKWGAVEGFSTRDEPASRSCLRCGEKFLSSGLGNRLCPRCRRGSC